MRAPRDIATRVTVLYALASAAWILLSGWAIEGLPGPMRAELETIKGLLYVVVMSMVLWVVTLRLSERTAEETVRTLEAEVALTRVVDTVRVGVVLIDHRRMVTYVNPAAATLLGIDAKRVVGGSFEELPGPAASQRAVAQLGDLIRTGTIDSLELVGDDGVARTVMATAAPLGIESTNTGWVLALSDVTSAQVNVERLTRLVQGYRFLNESAMIAAKAPDAAHLMERLVSTAVEVGGFVGAWTSLRNASGHLTLGAHAGMGELALETAELMVTQADDVRSAMATQLREGAVVVGNDVLHSPANPWNAAAVAEGFASHAVFGILGPEGLLGSVAFVARSTGAFDHDSIDLLETLQSVVSFALERIILEERRSAVEDALDRSERAYRRLFEANPMVMWVYDMNTLGFLAVNDAAVKVYGYSREEFSGMTIADIRPSSDVPSIMKHTARSFDGFDDAGVWTHRTATGHEFPVHVFTHTIEWDGRHAKLVMSVSLDGDA